MGSGHSSFFFSVSYSEITELLPEDRTLEVFSIILLPPKSCTQLIIDLILLAPQIKGLHNFFSSNSIIHSVVKFFFLW